MKIFKLESTSTAIFKNTVIGFFCRVFTYLNFAIVAYIFGAQISTDIYYLGTSFVAFCSGIFIVVITNVFSPILIRVRVKESIDNARKFAGSFFSFLSFVIIFLSIILSFFSVQIFSIISNFPISSIKENQLMLILFPSVILLTIASEFGRVYIQSMGYFSIIARITLIQSFLFIVFILTLSGIFKTSGLVVALILSLIIQLIFLYFFCKKNKIVPIVNKQFNNLHLELFKTSTPLLAAHIITLLVTYFLDYIASGLEPGTLTSITFANKLYMLPMLLLFSPMLEVVNTKFSEYYHTNKALLVEKFIQLQRFFIMILTPIMVIFFFFRLDIVKIFFLRGAFGEKEAIITANTLGVYSFTIVSFCQLAIISRVYYIMQKTGMSSLVGAVNQIAMILLAFFGARKIGYMAIPLAKAFSELIFMLPISFWLVNKYLPLHSLKKIGIPLLTIFFLSSILGYFIFNFAMPVERFSYFIIKNEKFSKLISMGLLIILYLIVYVSILYKANFLEMKLLFVHLKKQILRYNH